jgi:putative aldouronate transport system substrate-binding protein
VFDGVGQRFLHEGCKEGINDGRKTTRPCSVTPSVVTTSCPDDKLELALRILDYGYTKEGMLFWNFNKQGVYWDYDAQGNINFLPIITQDPLGQNDAVNKLSAITGQGASIQMTRLIQLRNQPEAVAANDLFYYPNQAITSYYVIPPGTTFTVEESNRRANLQNQITTYAQEMITKFVTGEEPLTGFDGFVNRLNQMGLQELIKINQASYDRWLAR